MRDVILGGRDGLVNILGIILGVIAGGGSNTVLVAAGFAAAITESISMGAVGYTSAVSEREYYQAERAREQAEIDATPEAERQGMEMLQQRVAQADVVITTARVPGLKAPRLIPADSVARMKPGSVIVDLAADMGGNCELTQPGELVVEHGVTIIGWFNLASAVPYHASQMYARNVSAFLLYLVKDGKLQINLEDEIVGDTLLTRGGEVVNARVREFFSLPALPAEPKEVAKS